jgi:hypothetical protein
MNALELADNIATCEPNLGKVATDCADMLRQQQAEIEALKQIIDANNLSQNIGQFVKPAKTLTDDAVRYQWLRNEYAHGRETYLAEGMPSGEKLDEYIDEQLRKAQEK